MGTITEMKNLSKMGQRCGLVKMIKPPENDPQPYYLAILPGVIDVIGEEAVNRFGAQLKSALIAEKASSESGEEDEITE